MLLVRDVMSKRLLTLRENASIGRAASEMKLARIRHFPVVNRAGELVGVVSNRDFLRAIGDGPVGRSLPVAKVMSRRMQTVRVDEPAARAVKLMRSLKIGSLPVVDAEQKLVGIVTETDFLEVAERALLGRTITRRGGSGGER